MSALTVGAEAPRKSVSEAAKASWQDPAIRQRRADAIRAAKADPAVRERISLAVKAALADRDVRDRMSEANRVAWSNPVVRKRRIDGIKAAAAARDGLSDEQRKLYRKLRRCGVDKASALEAVRSGGTP